MATKKLNVLKGKNKATLKTIEIILNAIAEGLTQRDASIIAGISEDTFSLWKRQDSDFSEQIRQKEIECKMAHINTIKTASKKNWTASAWWLERKHKEEFSKQNQAEVSFTLNSELEKALERINKLLPD